MYIDYMEKQKQQPQRLQSLDALRGFDMLFIMGGASLFVALATMFPNPYFKENAGQMEHVEWLGLAHNDSINPLKIIYAGISNLPIVPLYCGYLVSVLTREATRKRYDGRGDL